MRPNGVKCAETLRDELPLVHVEMVHFSCENPSRLPPTAAGSHWLHIAPAGCQRAAATLREYRLKTLPVIESKQSGRLASCVYARG
jgi:hypothetical protein